MGVVVSETLPLDDAVSKLRPDTKWEELPRKYCPHVQMQMRLPILEDDGSKCTPMGCHAGGIASRNCEFSNVLAPKSYNFARNSEPVDDASTLSALLYLLPFLSIPMSKDRAKNWVLEVVVAVFEARKVRIWRAFLQTRSTVWGRAL